MSGKRRKFIDKKNSVTYRLVPRCQLDPDGDASEHVLVPINEYNYEKHEKLNIKLPESVLPPPAEDISSIKKHLPVKGPHPNWDPDIVAALDDDFSSEGSDNDLEDDFIAKANGPIPEKGCADEFESGSEDCDSNGGLFSDDDSSVNTGCDEEKSRFTQYSLTSAVTNCTEERQTFNEHFEKFFETYDEDQIGALDGEDIEGYLSPDSKLVNEMVKDFQQHKKRFFLEDDLDDNMKNTIMHLAAHPNKEKLVEVILEKPSEDDCESIISKYSNKYNHPTTIKADRKEKPVKISTANPLKQKLTKSNLKQLDREAKANESDEDSYLSDDGTVTSMCNIRPKDETPEQRRLRKQNVKQMRRENRMFKKENKLAFKEEKKKQVAIALNAQRMRGTCLL